MVGAPIDLDFASFNEPWNYRSGHIQIMWSNPQLKAKMQRKGWTMKNVTVTIHHFIPIVAVFIQGLPSSPASSFEMMCSLGKLLVSMIGFIEQNLLCGLS